MTPDGVLCSESEGYSKFLRANGPNSVRLSVCQKELEEIEDSSIVLGVMPKRISSIDSPWAPN